MAFIGITGGTGTLGSLLCRQLKNSGWNIAYWSRSKPLNFGDGDIFNHCDFSTLPIPESAIPDNFPALKVLVLMGGVDCRLDFQYNDSRVLQNVLWINAFSQLSLLETLCKKCVIQPGARIFTVSSKTVTGYEPESFVYSISKLILENGVLHIAHSFNERQYQVLILRPGFLGFAMKETMGAGPSAVTYGEPNEEAGALLKALVESIAPKLENKTGSFAL